MCPRRIYSRHLSDNSRDQILYIDCVWYSMEFELCLENSPLWGKGTSIVFERFHSYPAGKDGAVLRIDTERSGRVSRTAYEGHFMQDRDYELKFGCVCSFIWQRTEWKWYIIGGRVLSLWKFYREWRVRWHLMDEQKSELVKETQRHREKVRLIDV